MAGSDPDVSIDVEKIRARLADLRVRIAALRSGISDMIKQGEDERRRLQTFLQDRASTTKNPRR